MSEIEKETAAESQGAAPAKKGGKKFILIGLIAILLIGGGGAGFYFWKIRGVEAAETETAKKPEKKTAKKEAAADDEETDAKPTKKTAAASAIPEDEDVKSVVELPPFIVNLADTDQARYLRMTVSLGIGGEGGASEKPEALFMTRVRNAMLAVLGDKTSEQILTAEGKAKLRKELLSAAKAASEEPEVQAIYITDFIVQL